MASRALVFGTFDLTHAGHFHLFECASKYADEVHVGVAHDSLVRAFKGADRPIYLLDQRLWIIERCRDVYAVHVYGDPDSQKSDNATVQKSLVEKVNPQFFIEGEDKKGSDLRDWIEAKGIKRISTPRLSTEITTAHFIHKIRQGAMTAPLEARRDVAPYYYYPS